MKSGRCLPSYFKCGGDDTGAASSSWPLAGYRATPAAKAPGREWRELRRFLAPPDPIGQIRDKAGCDREAVAGPREAEDQVLGGLDFANDWDMVDGTAFGARAVHFHVLGVIEERDSGDRIA